jgi:16S rRNA G966 N2-methylase RsmD
MAKYGIIYMGSKNDLAERILSALPPAENFYDLFGGGFSVTHCALMHFSNKWTNFYFNEINSGLIDLIKKAIDGHFNYDRFKPKWVTRDEFHRLKSIDPYISICWSFGNSMCNYLYGADIEDYKRSLHQAVVFNEFDETAKSVLGIDKFYFENISDRRAAVARIIKNTKNNAHLNKLKQLHHVRSLIQIQHLERLERIQKLSNIQSQKHKVTFSSLSYDQVTIKPNSIIYCDPPYINTEWYKIAFDHKKFYEWVYYNPHPVFFSEYQAPKQFKTAYIFTHMAKFSPDAGKPRIFEKLFCNDVGYNLLKSIT